MEPNTTISSPDTLLDDHNSMEFYVLRDESIAISKKRTDLPYYQNRATYLSSGRYSPKYRKVIFWPDPINPKRAFDLLIENKHIESNFNWMVSGATTRIAKKGKSNPHLDRLDGVRRAGVENLMKKGYKIQTPDENQSKKDEQPAN